MSESRIFVVGDIHGCVDELNRLLDAIAPPAPTPSAFSATTSIAVRRRRASSTASCACASEGPSCVFLKGNHEDMFLDFLGYGGHYGDAFLWNGGDVTLEIQVGEPEAQFVEAVPQRLE